MSFSDPFDVTTVQSPSVALSDKLEEATDAYGNACDDAAIKENEYLLRFSKAYAVAVEDKVAQTIRREHCNAQEDVTEARQDWNRAIATEKRTKAKVEELRHRLMAALSHQKFIGGQS